MQIKSLQLSLFLLAFIILISACSAKQNVLQQFKELSYSKNGKVLHYRLYIPDNLDVTKQYPLILYLHGAGGRGDDNKKQIEVEYGAKKLVHKSVQQLQQSFVLVPQCPKKQTWHNIKPTPPPFINYKITNQQGNYLSNMTVDVINQLQQQYSIDSKRIYLSGYSMGGSGVWNMLFWYPDLFAAASIHAGPGDPGIVAKIKNIPIWIFQGQHDKLVKVENAREMVQALENVNNPVKYTEYQDLAHGISKTSYDEDGLFPWFFSQTKK